MTDAIIRALAEATVDLPVPGEWIIQGGAVSLLMVVAWFVFTGRLIPRSTYKELQEDRDYWRQIALMASTHTEQLLPAAHIATQVARELTAQVDAAMHDVAAEPRHNTSGQGGAR